MRDSVGEVLLAAGIPLQPSNSAFLAELKALNVALKVVADVGFANVVFEMDCFGLVKGIKSKNCPVGADSLLFIDALLKSHRFLSISFIHVNRECNALAHTLAQWANSLNSPLILLEEFLLSNIIVQRDKCSTS